MVSERNETVKHTPGPWTWKYDSTGNGIDLEGPQPAGDYRGNVCYIRHSEHIKGTTRAEAEANANLIAAAPDLLAAAAEMVDSWDRSLETTPAILFAARIDRLSAAIAKAKGGAR
jgi:hypothetical protein